jgi:ribosomal protein L11
MPPQLCEPNKLYKLYKLQQPIPVSISLYKSPPARVLTNHAPVSRLLAPISKMKVCEGETSVMNIEAEVRDIKQHIIEISRKMDELLEERETVSIMRLEEGSLSRFVQSEPDIYRIEDLKVLYK